MKTDTVEQDRLINLIVDESRTSIDVDQFRVSVFKAFNDGVNIVALARTHPHFCAPEDGTNGIGIAHAGWEPDVPHRHKSTNGLIAELYRCWFIIEMHNLHALAFAQTYMSLVDVIEELEKRA